MSHYVDLNRRAVSTLAPPQATQDRLGLPIYSPLFSIMNSSDRFDAKLKRAEIEDVTGHALMHTTCSRLAILGVHLSVVQKIKRHKSPSMTAQCAHLALKNKF